jgi:putative transposase
MNPLLPQRRSIRLKGYDYTRSGAYFITISCQNMSHRFGRVKYGEMVLNDFGKVAFDEWMNLETRFQAFELDVFQIMPNHMHGILVIKDQNELLALPPETDEENSEAFFEGHEAKDGPGSVGVGNMVGAYKSLVFKGCLDIAKRNNEVLGKFWLRNYYERIIRNEKAYRNISNYILNNPMKWQTDKYNSC